MKNNAGFEMKALLVRMRISEPIYDNLIDFLRVIGKLAGRLQVETPQTKATRMVAYTKSSPTNLDPYRKDRTDARSGVQVADCGKEYHRPGIKGRSPNKIKFCSPKRLFNSIRKNLPGWVLSDLYLKKEKGQNNNAFWIYIWYTPQGENFTTQTGETWMSEELFTPEQEGELFNKLSTPLYGVHEHLHIWENPAGDMTITFTVFHDKSRLTAKNISTIYDITMNSNGEIVYTPRNV